MIGHLGDLGIKHRGCVRKGLSRSIEVVTKLTRLKEVEELETWVHSRQASCRSGTPTTAIC